MLGVTKGGAAMDIRQEGGALVLYKERTAIGTARRDGDALWVQIDPAWRRRGYGSYLLKELLRRHGGLDPKTPSCFTAPLPQGEGGRRLAAEFGFAEQNGALVRRHTPDFSAVAFCHEFLAARLAPGGFFIDATCGNGHDTAFLCRLAGPQGRVLALDIQPRAVQATNARLAAAGQAGIGHAVVHDHARLRELAAPATADCVVFNFGWLPGAPHGVHSAAEGSVAALRAALELLKPGGVLAAVLYSGQVIGDGEKQAALAFLRALPLAQYTVLECRFANWADTAPLPCFVLKKDPPAGPKTGGCHEDRNV